MHKRFLIAGAITGGIGVILGAFGAHGLQTVTQDEKIVHAFQTGVQYQLYHALALLVVGILSERNTDKMIRWAGDLFIAGTILFAGSIYLLTWLKIQGSSFVKIAGPITPIGGVCFILGWLFLLLGLLKRKSS